jgi:hypothetical protein
MQLQLFVTSGADVEKIATYLQKAERALLFSKINMQNEGNDIMEEDLEWNHLLSHPIIIYRFITFALILI